MAGGGGCEPNIRVCDGGVKFDPAFHLSITLHACKLRVQGLLEKQTYVLGAFLFLR